MILDSKPINLDRLVRLLFNGLLVVCLLWLLNYLSDVLLPFAIALSMAYFINPVVVKIEQKTHHRGVAVALSFLLFIVVFGLGLTYIIPKVVGEIKDMIVLVQKITEETNLNEAAQKRLPVELWEALREPLKSEWLKTQVSKSEVQQVIKTSAQKILPGVLGVVQGTASVLFSLMGLVVIGLYLVFVLLDYPKYRNNWKRLLPPDFRESAGTFVQDFDGALSRYFRAQAMVAGLAGILFALGFQIIGLPFALLLGLMMALLNMVPYLQVLGIFPCAFLIIVQGLETGESFWSLGLYVFLVFAVVQLIQDAILVPKIMGGVTGLSPAMILLSLSVWGKLLGLFGLVVAIPVTCLGLAYYKQLLNRLEQQSETN
jgi:predicted PurR-regulated permease PerM